MACACHHRVMAKPLIPVEVIYERVLSLLDDEGSAALTNLAAGS